MLSCWRVSRIPSPSIPLYPCAGFTLLIMEALRNGSSTVPEHTKTVKYTQQVVWAGCPIRGLLGPLVVLGCFWELLFYSLGPRFLPETWKTVESPN